MDVHTEETKLKLSRVSQRDHKLALSYHTSLDQYYNQWYVACFMAKKVHDLMTFTTG
jgi:hypothetical protein